MPAETFQLARQEHAYSDLLALAENSSLLSDEQWTLLQKTISDTFGRPLALAAARGRLVVSSELPPIEMPAATMVRADSKSLEAFPMSQNDLMERGSPEKKPRWGGFRFTGI